MVHHKTRNTVVIVDNVDIDNQLAAVAAAHPVLDLNLKAVIVTGRPAHPDRNARINESSREYSHLIRRLNTRRMKGLLTRMGWDGPVMEGLIPPKTLVPHRVHIDEHELDLKHDNQHTRGDGSFTHAIEVLCGLDGPIDLVIGGPLTEVASLMREPRLQGRLGTLTCQLGMFGFGQVEVMGGGRKQFNAACDPAATRDVLANYPGQVYLVPTDVTKLPGVGFDNPSALRRIGIVPELLDQYEIFYREALEPRGERIYPHDVHPVFLMAQLRGLHLADKLYAWEEARITGVNEEGEIDALFGPAGSSSPSRFIVKRVLSEEFRYLLDGVIR